MDRPSPSAPPSSTSSQENGEQEEPEHAAITKGTIGAYVPHEAWGDWQPAKLFGWNGCQAAKAYARKHRLALFAVEISNESRAMNYVVGGWGAVQDMLVHRQLHGRQGTLLDDNPDALGAVYECLFKDQSSLPIFDLEFYADRKHGNGHRLRLKEMDRMTRVVAQAASALIAELFPDQVQLRLGDDDEGRMPCAPHPKAHAGWPCRVLRARHYEAPQGLVTPPVSLDPGWHWLALDASLNAKRSQHLILDSQCGLCWETTVDQAIFVGLLLRRIYRAAFALDDSAGGQDDATTTTDRGGGKQQGLSWYHHAEFRTAARKLFVSDLHGDAMRIWTTVIDPVVYKSFQLIRTAYSSKRTQNRPLLPRPEVFDAEGEYQDSAKARSEVLRHTLVGRIPLGQAGTQVLSFARCYPRMFGPQSGAPGSASLGLPSCSLPLSAWRWVPNYQGRGPDAPPRLPHQGPGQLKRGPWEFRKLRQEVRNWLHRTDPTAPPALGKLSSSRAGLGATMSRISDGQVASWYQEIDEYAGGTQEATSAAECVARYILDSSDLQPWVEEAGGVTGLAASLKIRVSGYRDKHSGRMRYGALIAPNLHYCPIQRAVHQGVGPFMLIDARYGRVRIKCLAGKCQRRELRPAIAVVPEYLDLIFPKVRGGGGGGGGSGGVAATKRPRESPPEHGHTKTVPGPAPKKSKTSTA